MPPGRDDAERARLDHALSQLEEAHVGTIHAFCADLLRERPIEAGIDPLFEVLTEPASARLFEEAFGRWLQDVLSSPPEGVRRALRRSAFGGDDGPVDRLRKAAWELAQWRDFTAPWTRNAFAREQQIDEVVAMMHDVADLTRNPASRNDPLFTGTDAVRRLSDEIRLQQTFGDAAASDYDGWEAGLADLSRDRTLANMKQGRGASYRDGVTRDRVVTALTELRARLDQLRMDADADLAALLQQELRGALDRYEALKARDGALDFLDLLLVARNLVRDNAGRAAGISAALHAHLRRRVPGHRPAAGRNPAAAGRRRSRRNRLAPRAASARPALSGWRSEAVDLSLPPRRRRHLSRRLPTARRLGRDSRAVDEKLPQRPGNPVIRECRIRAGDDRRRPDAAGGIRPARTAPAGDRSASRRFVALPVPQPYARRYVTGRSIEQSLPGAVGALVDWIVNESNWKVTERSGAAPVKVAAKHICLLFRRFVSWESDVTRPYVEALEARGIAHVLVGGRAFHEREEVEALRAALTAIEWPDDELSVFATLRGPFFAIGDEELLEWAHRFGRKSGERFSRGSFHPFRVPKVFDENTPPEIAHLRPIAESLWLLQRLHRHRNYVSRPGLGDRGSGLGAAPPDASERTSGGVSGTLQELLAATRAHVGFALRTGGEQALANVLHIAELARQYEMSGGISFRGFVEELQVASETAQASEAPILEEDSDGVRMMTVHKAKGLEFPVVILADSTCRLSRPDAGRWIDPDGNVCALKLGGWAPIDLLLHGSEEAERDRAEGQRLAYVAATRARDLLVVPVVGDEIYEGGWLDPLMPAVYPSPFAREARAAGVGCPAFPSKDSVLNRPDGDPARPMTVAPGSYLFGGGGRRYSVVWWDPHILRLDADAGYGLRRDDLISKDGDPAAVASRLAAHHEWRDKRDAATARARVPSLRVRTATSVAADRTPDATSGIAIAAN